MKKIILPLVLILAFSGCSMKNEIDNKIPAKVSNNSSSEIEISKEVSVDYEVESIVLSKGYQSIEPHAEILVKSKPPKFLISLGLIECSEVYIDKITKLNNEINIYTNKVMQDGKNQIVVPQLLIQFKGLDISKLEDLKFNIIGTNYKPISLKYDKTHALNKIYAEYKLTSNTIPNVNVINNQEKYLWDIELNNVFDTSEYNFPIVNFKAQIDAITGEIISSNKKIIAKYISEGKILDYNSQNTIIYKTKEVSNDTEFETLWSLMANENDISKIYTTHNSIYTAKSSPDGKHIALIESSSEGITNLYLINLVNKTTQKITPNDCHHTWNIAWHGNNLLYFLNNDSENKSTLFAYNIENNDYSIISIFPKCLSNMVTNNKLTVFEEYDEKNENKNIYLLNDKENLVKIDNGFNTVFLGENKVAYLKKVGENNDIFLYLYDVKSKNIVSKLHSNVKSFKYLDNGSILLIKSNNQDSNYSLFKYNINSDSIEKIIDIISEDIYYDKESNILYFNIIPPIDGVDKNCIYELKLQEKVN